MFECKICGKVLNNERSLRLHVAVSSGKNDGIHCPIYEYILRYQQDSNISKNNLEKMYITDKKSTPQISKELKMNKKTLLILMHHYGIHLRNTSEASLNRVQRDGQWCTGLTKYDHPSIMRYAMARMGKNNPYFTAPGFEEREKKWAEGRLRGWKIFNARCNPKSTERRMTKILDKYSIKHLSQFYLFFHKDGKKKWRIYDYLIGNLIIEMNGDYFHANPMMFKEDDEIKVAASKKFKAKEIWTYDEEKMKVAKDQGYNTLVIWERDFKQMSDDEVADMIKKNLEATKNEIC